MGKLVVIVANKNAINGAIENSCNKKKRMKEGKRRKKKMLAKFKAIYCFKNCIAPFSIQLKNN